MSQFIITLYLLEKHLLVLKVNLSTYQLKKKISLTKEEEILSDTFDPQLTYCVNFTARL